MRSFLILLLLFASHVACIWTWGKKKAPSSSLSLSKPLLDRDVADKEVAIYKSNFAVDEEYVEYRTECLDREAGYVPATDTAGSLFLLEISNMILLYVVPFSDGIDDEKYSEGAPGGTWRLASSSKITDSHLIFQVNPDEEVWGKRTRSLVPYTQTLTIRTVEDITDWKQNFDDLEKRLLEAYSSKEKDQEFYDKLDELELKRYAINKFKNYDSATTASDRDQNENARWNWRPGVKIHIVFAPKSADWLSRFSNSYLALELWRNAEAPRDLITRGWVLTKQDKKKKE